ncbi:MAG: helix-turn-helix domain-containing protein [Muribaculaceae bacterium]|nr:helix-turn-helix domain-containing protein [Muribaculaceae bacterium]
MMIEPKTLPQMEHLYKIANYDSAVDGADYVYVHVTPDRQDYIEALQEAIRFNGMIIFMVKSGNISFAVNMDRINLGPNSMLLTGANSIVTVDTDSISDLEAYALFVNDEFIHDLNFEVIILNNLPIASKRSPVVRLDADSAAQVAAYMNLLDMNMRLNVGDGNEVFAKSISRSLLTAMLYQLMIISIRGNQFEEVHDDWREADDSAGEHSRPRSRRILYTHEFVRLVRKYFRHEHTVRFYANKLCISPKYLSLVVKEACGRTAAEIIDEYLLLEAKNLLRFSGKNIQQIAFELNFANQSSFGKYFKNLTGLSPSEFQNS